MIKFFNKITKTIIIILGFLILTAITAIGAVGLYYKKEAETFYTNTKDLAVSSLNTVKTSIESVQKTLTDANANLKGTIDSANTAIDNAKKSLEDIKSAASSSGASTTDIDNAISNIDSLKSTIADFQSFAGNIPSSMENIINSLTSSGVYTTIQDIINLLPSQDEFNKTYNSISIGLTAAGGSILGIYILSIILGFTFFKHSCGVRIRRFHKKADLIKHVDKVFEKYPELYQEFYPNN